MLWTFHDRFGESLSGMPAEAWRDPERQGWRKVKQNGRRQVWLARIGGRAYYLKYNFSGGLRDRLKRLVRQRACEKEWSGGIFAMSAGIAAARPMGYTKPFRMNGRTCQVLVTEAIEPAYPLNELWRQVRADMDAARRRADQAQVIERLAELIARAHQAGFEHLDMHAANILVQAVAPREYRCVFVDLQSARLGVSLDDRAVVRNLAQLNQWFRKNSTIGERLRFLRSYLRWRNEYETVFPYGRPLGLHFRGLIDALGRAAGRHARGLWEQRDRRLGRSGQYFRRVRLANGWRGNVFLCCKHPTDESAASRRTFERNWWERTFAAPLAWFSAQRSASCKTSHSASVARAVVPHEDVQVGVILKRPLARNLWRRMVQLLPPSRSRRAWRVGNALLHREIATARPLAVFEKRLGPFVLDSVLLTEAIEDAQSLETFLISARTALSPREWAAIKRDLVFGLVRELRRLEERGVYHRDCKTGNILVVRDSSLKLIWIDMDGVRIRRRALTRREQLAPLMRLHVSLLDVPGLTRTDRVRFLKNYFARFGAATDAWRRVWKEIAQLAERKQAALARRRAWKLSRYGRI